MITLSIRDYLRRRKLAKVMLPPPNRHQFFRDAEAALRLNESFRAQYIKELCEARAFHEAKSHYSPHYSSIEVHYLVHDIVRKLKHWCAGMGLVSVSKCSRDVATDEERMRDALFEIDQAFKFCRDTNYGVSKEYLADSLIAAQASINKVRDTFWPVPGE